MSLFEACLYLLVIAFLFGSAIYVLSRDPFARVNQAYFLLALAQLCWVGSLFVFNATAAGSDLIWIGRANFAAAALVAPAVLFFVQSLLNRRHRCPLLLLLETVIVAAVSLLTGLVDMAETIVGGVHTTTYGPLFLLYVAHILLYLVPALYRALAPNTSLPRRQQRQARIVGIGLLITSIIAISTNVFIPYAYGNFAFINAGTLATIAALGTISYAALYYKLFNVRVVLRAAFVYGVMIAFALELYSLSVDALTKMLPLDNADERRLAAASVAFIVNGFTQEPIKSWLERLADSIVKRNSRTRHGQHN